MKACFARFLAPTLLVAVFLADDSASADPGRSRSFEAGSRARAALDREFETAMLHMDRNLAALLGSKTMDCDGDDGMETCWVSLDPATSAETQSGPAHH